VVLQAIGKGSSDGETLGRAGKVHQGFGERWTGLMG